MGVNSSSLLVGQKEDYLIDVLLKLSIGGFYFDVK